MSASDPTLGEICAFGFNFPPRGWARCDGQVLPISQNTALFSLLGTTYGGDGRSTFALPDLRNRAPLHAGTGPGLKQRLLGAKSGATTVKLTVDQLPAHTHVLAVSNAAGNPAQASPAGNVPAGTSEQPYATAAANTAMAATAVGQTGGAKAHNNLSPYLTLNFCIALQGVYPPRN